MRALSAADLLQVWERGIGQPAVSQALLLLSAACPEASPEALAQLSIGQRDAHLLTLREWLFGAQLASLAVCPNCSDRLQFGFNVADIRAEAPAETSEPLSLSWDDYTARFRLPDSSDLLALAKNQDIAANRNLLLTRCVVKVQHDGAAESVEQLPAAVVDAIAEKMAQADPQADVQLSLACPACGHNWLAAFDIVSFLWAEIDAWAQCILRDVHILASTYGWREADILALSARRRQVYLDMIGGM